MSLEDRALYRAFDIVEPIGEQREDLRHAFLSHLIASTVSKKPPRVADLIPEFWGRYGEKELRQRLRDVLGLEEGSGGS